MTDEDVAKLVERLRKEEAHLECDDCWYSCPASGECCRDDAGTDCTCGADRLNAIHREAAAALIALAESRDHWIECHRLLSQELASLREDRELLEPVLAFLRGEKALDGAWFGERKPGKPKYWWRAHLRAALRAARGEK